MQPRSTSGRPTAGAWTGADGVGAGLVSVVDVGMVVPCLEMVGAGWLVSDGWCGMAYGESRAQAGGVSRRRQVPGVSSPAAACAGGATRQAGAALAKPCLVVVRDGPNPI